MEDPLGWVALTSAEARAIAPAGLPASTAEWRKLFSAIMTASSQADMEELLVQCNAHPQLCHYRPCLPTLEGRLGINNAVHGTRLRLPNPQAVCRLLCGGQGLRGMDPVLATPASPRTACLHCLADGRREKETLEHFLFACPLTLPIRRQPDVAECWAQQWAIVEVHRNVWPWRKLQIIVKALQDMLQARSSWLSQEGLSTASRVELRLDSLWSQAEAGTEPADSVSTLV